MSRRRVLRRVLPALVVSAVAVGCAAVPGSPSNGWVPVPAVGGQSGQSGQGLAPQPSRPPATPASPAAPSTPGSPSTAAPGAAATVPPSASPTIPPPASPSVDAGDASPASSADLAAHPNHVHVATWGSDSGSGAPDRPVASVAAAIARIPAGSTGTVVVHGGVYRQGGIRVPADRTVHIVGSPGEQVVFSGSVPVWDWRYEGSVAWTPYSPRPVTDGSGISFSAGMNVARDAGRFADQAWAGPAQLQQVTSLGEVSSGRFFVDRAAGRLYVSAGDVGAGVEVSGLAQFVSLSGRNQLIEGVTVQRYSNDPAVYGVVRVEAGSSNVTMRDLAIVDSAFQAVQFAGSPSQAGLIRGATMERVTIDRSGWMGVSATLIDDLTMRNVRISGSNPFGEYTFSPQSGALKTSRAVRVKVLDSVFENNNSHGLWFDQSNVDVDVVGNRIVGNAGSSVFWEISDDLLLADNVIVAPAGGRAVKIAGASGVKMVNNTVVGGVDPVGVFVDVRSMPGCADPARPLCANSYSSDRDTVRARPASLDWMPRVDMMINNVFGLPSGAGYCGAATVVCVTGSNGPATVPFASVFHAGSVIDGNVYVYGGAASAVRTPNGAYATPGAFSAATGFERSADAGSYVSADGTLSSSLASIEHRAVPVPGWLGLDGRLPAGSLRRGNV